MSLPTIKSSKVSDVPLSMPLILENNVMQDSDIKLNDNENGPNNFKVENLDTHSSKPENSDSSKPKDVDNIISGKSLSELSPLKTPKKHDTVEKNTVQSVTGSPCIATDESSKASQSIKLGEDKLSVGCNYISNGNICGISDSSGCGVDQSKNSQTTQNLHDSKATGISTGTCLNLDNSENECSSSPSHGKVDNVRKDLQDKINDVSCPTPDTNKTINNAFPKLNLGSGEKEKETLPLNEYSLKSNDNNQQRKPVKDEQIMTIRNEDKNQLVKTSQILSEDLNFDSKRDSLAYDILEKALNEITNGGSELDDARTCVDKNVKTYSDSNCDTKKTVQSTLKESSQADSSSVMEVEEINKHNVLALSYNDKNCENVTTPSTIANKDEKTENDTTIQTKLITETSESKLSLISVVNPPLNDDFILCESNGNISTEIVKSQPVSPCEVKSVAEESKSRLSESSRIIPPLIPESEINNDLVNCESNGNIPPEIVKSEPVSPCKVKSDEESKSRPSESSKIKPPVNPEPELNNDLVNCESNGNISTEIVKSQPISPCEVKSDGEESKSRLSASSRIIPPLIPESEMNEDLVPHCASIKNLLIEDVKPHPVKSLQEKDNPSPYIKFGLKHCRVNLRNVHVSDSMLRLSEDTLSDKPNFSRLKRKLEAMLQSSQMEEERGMKQIKRMRTQKANMRQSMLNEVLKVKKKYKL